MDVLLVDDSRVMRGLVRRTLRQAGFDLGNVVEAENGQEALETLSKGLKVDLVLSDWNMPVMNGIDLLAALRQGGNTVKFGFVTSESTPAMRARAMSTGALFLLTKPFGADEMHHVLTEAGLKAQSKPTGGAGSGYSTMGGTFDAKLVTTMLSSLVNAAVQVKPGPKLVPTATPCFSARWTDEANQIRYVGFCELPLAAALGGALGLRPAAWVLEQLRAPNAAEVLHPSVYEVFNVMSRSFNDCGSVHVKLASLHDPPAPPADLVAFDRAGRARLDLVVTVPGYAAGKLSIVSATAELITKS